MSAISLVVSGKERSDTGLSFAMKMRAHKDLPKVLRLNYAKKKQLR